MKWWLCVGGLGARQLIGEPAPVLRMERLGLKRAGASAGSSSSVEVAQRMVGDSRTGGEDAGLGRAVEQLWREYGAGADRDRLTHTCEQAANRRWREDVVAAADGANLDFAQQDGEA